jgi:hypothetical protein
MYDNHESHEFQPRPELFNTFSDKDIAVIVGIAFVIGGSAGFIVGFCLGWLL